MRTSSTISIAAAVLGMLLIALVGVGGFTVLAQRRLRAIGLLAAQGATQRHIRLVVRANGAATGIVGAIAGAVLGFVAWLAYRPQAENSAHHVMGAFQLPWTVIGISMALAVIATYFAASRPAKAIARVPIAAGESTISSIMAPRRRRSRQRRCRSASGEIVHDKGGCVTRDVPATVVAHRPARRRWRCCRWRPRLHP